MNPTRSSRLSRSLAWLGVALLTPSCFAVTDLDRFEKASPSNFSDLRVTVRGLVSHVAERFEYRVVDSSNVIQSRGIIVPLGGPDATFLVRGGVPKQNGPFRLDFFADHDSSGNWSKVRPDINPDHSWRIPLDASLLDERGSYVVSFVHNTSFTDLDSPAPPAQFGKPVSIQLVEMEPFMGRRVEVRVAVSSTRRVVALFRVPQIAAPTLTAAVEGMTEPGEAYSVDVYTDDGRSAGIRAFRFAASATADGLTATFNGTTPAASPGISVTEVADADPPPLL